LSSSSNTEVLSPYWMTTPTVTQFTQMYTTNEILELTSGLKTGSQYYLCGN
jgi:hypothetical protein